MAIANRVQTQETHAANVMVTGAVIALVGSVTGASSFISDSQSTDMNLMIVASALTDWRMLLVLVAVLVVLAAFRGAHLSRRLKRLTIVMAALAAVGAVYTAAWIPLNTDVLDSGAEPLVGTAQQLPKLSEARWAFHHVAASVAVMASSVGIIVLARRPFDALVSDRVV